VGGSNTDSYHIAYIEAAVQLLRFLGFTRIVVYASKVQFDYLKELGATEYIDRGEVPLEKLVVTPPVKVVYDASPVLAGALNAAYDSVVDGGKVTTVRPQAQTDRESRGITVVRCAGLYAGPDVLPPIGDPAHYPGVPEHTSFGKLMIEELPKMIEQGAVVVCVSFECPCLRLTHASQTGSKSCPTGLQASLMPWSG
jgi:NADPH:quinone reductase-like Zn-dependent oxidoreductase